MKSAIKDKQYNDTLSLISLCEAHEQYDAEDLGKACSALQRAPFRHQTPEQMAQIKAFRDTVEREYDACITEERRKRKEEQDRRAELLFPAADIYVTDAQLASMSKRGRDRTTFYTPTTICFCDDGTNVYRLWITDAGYVMKSEFYSTKKNSGKSSSGSSGKKPASTEFDVDAFSNPEDFYDWYMDDFIDFEEAEEYYYDHGED